MGWVTRPWRPAGHFEKLSGQWAWLQLQAIHTRMFLACWTQTPYSALPMSTPHLEWDASSTVPGSEESGLLLLGHGPTVCPAHLHREGRQAAGQGHSAEAESPSERSPICGSPLPAAVWIQHVPGDPLGRGGGRWEEGCQANRLEQALSTGLHEHQPHPNSQKQRGNSAEASSGNVRMHLQALSLHHLGRLPASAILNGPVSTF